MQDLSWPCVLSVPTAFWDFSGLANSALATSGLLASFSTSENRAIRAGPLLGQVSVDMTGLSSHAAPARGWASRVAKSLNHFAVRQSSAMAKLAQARELPAFYC